ncbi:unnamed protein product [Echinostoma caproni]|uniref:Selenocysteine lyase n=1 Tax=Echinostoma caproni TaxID=27848 RepID=A0A183B0U4_9TREM|nr:unnamed protein product [Echinostoma caproni]
MIQAHPDDLIFTSGGTEANHSVFHTFVNIPLDIKPHIVTVNTEHPSVLVPLRKLHTDGLIDLTVIPVSHKTGVAHYEDVLAALKPNQTVLVSVMLANNETGAISPIQQIVQSIREWERNVAPSSLPLGRVFVHSDLAQAVGKLPVNVRSLGLDYATIVGHKLHSREDEEHRLSAAQENVWTTGQVLPVSV